MNFNKRSVIYVLIITGFVLSTLVLTPWQIKNILSLNKKIDELRKNINRVENDSRSKKKFIDDNENIKRDILDLKSNIISSQNISGLQAYISAKAKSNDVEIVETGSAPLRPGKNIGKEKIVYVPIEIKIKSGYHNLGRFLSEIEKGKYLLKTGNMLILGAKPYHDVAIEFLALTKENSL